MVVGIKRELVLHCRKVRIVMASWHCYMGWVPAVLLSATVGFLIFGFTALPIVAVLLNAESLLLILHEDQDVAKYVGLHSIRLHFISSLSLHHSPSMWPHTFPSVCFSPPQPSTSHISTDQAVSIHPPTDHFINVAIHLFLVQSSVLCWFKLCVDSVSVLSGLLTFMWRSALLDYRYTNLLTMAVLGCCIVICLFSFQSCFYCSQSSYSTRQLTVSVTYHLQATQSVCVQEIVIPLAIVSFITNVFAAVLHYVVVIVLDLGFVWVTLAWYRWYDIITVHFDIHTSYRSAVVSLTVSLIVQPLLLIGVMYWKGLGKDTWGGELRIFTLGLSVLTAVVWF